MANKVLLSRLVMCICEIVVGVLLLINPIGFTTGIVIIAGIVFSVMGVLSILGYFRAEPEDAQKGQGLAKGLCGILCGLFCILRSEWFIVTFPIMAMMYGVIILITGIVRIQWAVDLLRMKSSQWYYAAVGALLAVIFSCVILCNPFETTVFLWKFVAISLFIEAVADLVFLVFVQQGSVSREE